MNMTGVYSFISLVESLIKEQGIDERRAVLVRKIKTFNLNIVKCEKEVKQYEKM